MVLTASSTCLHSAYQKPKKRIQPVSRHHLRSDNDGEGANNEKDRVWENGGNSSPLRLQLHLVLNVLELLTFHFSIISGLRKYRKKQCKEISYTLAYIPQMLASYNRRIDPLTTCTQSCNYWFGEEVVELWLEAGWKYVGECCFSNRTCAAVAGSAPAWQITRKTMLWFLVDWAPLSFF